MEVSSSAVQHEDIPISATRLAPKPTVTCGGGDGSVEVGAAPLAPGRCRSACQRLCRPFLLEFHPLPEGASRAATLHRALLCPPHGPVARLLTLAVVVVGVWAVLWAVTGDAALPGGNYFALVVLLAACIVCGAAVERLRLPALLGNVRSHIHLAQPRAAVASWLACRYANSKVRGSNPGLDRLRIFMV